ncbi:uncharacterized protein LOC135207448 [Macrobrachium nipponense]|uniref:uncharacterized protein LOC135207448 n=1 Tax=Macrobrachium nipponense TaxID=159736 RepID=UPI0030C811BE
MPFGMKNAACTFQRLMNRVICGLEGTEIYIDDLVVHSNDWRTHLKPFIIAVDASDVGIGGVLFQRSDDGEVRPVSYYSPTCGKLYTSLDHGAHVCRGIITCDSHLACYVLQVYVSLATFALRHFPRLRIPREDGAVVPSRHCWRYYSRDQRASSHLLSCSSGDQGSVRRNVGSHYPGLSRKDEVAPARVDVGDASPVKQSPYRLSPEKRAIVEDEIKYMLEHNLIQPSKPFIIAVDASDVGIGGVLFQRSDDGEVRPVSYYSRKLLEAERKYSTIEKEALALVRTLVHFKPYVTNFSFPIEIWTDHNPLVFIERMKGSNQRILRWALQLQEFNLIIIHLKGWITASRMLSHVSKFWPLPLFLRALSVFLVACVEVTSMSRVRTVNEIAAAWDEEFGPYLDLRRRS